MLRFLGFLIVLIGAVYYASYQTTHITMSPFKNVAIIGVSHPAQGLEVHKERVLTVVN